MHTKSKNLAKATIVAATALLAAIFVRQALGLTQPETDFPSGYDAVTAAPGSHRVIFENALVRVLEVSMPPLGKTEPMHHHHWPGFFLEWDTGGKSPHIRYHQPADKVREIESQDNPAHPGRWSVHWMNPESMHAIETVENFASPADPLPVRVEIKVRP